MRWRLLENGRGSPWSLALFVLLLALGVRLLLWVVLGHVTPIQDDQRDYLALAGQLSATGHFSDPLTGLPTAYRDPGFPAFLRAVLGGGDALWRIWAAQILLSSAAGVFLCLAAQLAMGEGAGWLSALLFLTRVDLATYSFMAYTETLSFFSFALLLYALARSDVDRRGGSPVMAVIAAASGVLTRAATVISILGLAAAAARWGRSTRRVAAIAVAAALLATIAWSARNWQTVGIFTPNTNGAMNLYLGNSPHTPLVHGYWSDSIISRPLLGLSEAARVRVSVGLVRDYVVTQPRRAALGVIMKIPDALELDRIFIGVSRRGQFPDRSPRLLLLLGIAIAMSSAIPMVLGLATVLNPGGHWLARAGQWAFLGILFTQSLTVAYPRYTEPAWVALIPGSALLVQRLARRERGAIIAVAIAALILFPVWMRELALGSR